MKIIKERDMKKRRKEEKGGGRRSDEEGKEGGERDKQEGGRGGSRKGGGWRITEAMGSAAGRYFSGFESCLRYSKSHILLKYS